MNLDAVETGLLRTNRSGDMRGGGLCDARLAHRLGNDGFERRLVDRMWNCRGRNRCFTTDVLAGMAAAVAELDRCLGATAMDFGDEPRQARQKAVVVDADLVPAMAAALLRRRHLDRDQACAAVHPRHVVGDALVGDEAVGIRRARGHRRHHDAVLDLDRTDPRRGEQDVHPEHLMQRTSS